MTFSWPDPGVTIDSNQLRPPVEMAAYRVAVVGACPAADSVARLLGQHGYAVEKNEQIEQALSQVESIDLVVGHLAELNREWQDAVQRLRHACDRVVIVLVGENEAECDGSAAIDAGADLWLPTSLVETLLVQSARALLRRSSGCFRLHYPRDTRLDASSCCVEFQGARIKLRRAEFRLLSYLIHHHGQWFSETALLSKVFGLRQAKQTALVRVHVREIRKALGELAGHVQSRRGHGYRFVDRC